MPSAKQDICTCGRILISIGHCPRDPCWGYLRIEIRERKHLTVYQRCGRCPGKRERRTGLRIGEIRHERLADRRIRTYRPPTTRADTISPGIVEELSSADLLTCLLALVLPYGAVVRRGRIDAGTSADIRHTQEGVERAGRTLSTIGAVAERFGTRFEILTRARNRRWLNARSCAITRRRRIATRRAHASYRIRARDTGQFEYILRGTLGIVGAGILSASTITHLLGGPTRFSKGVGDTSYNTSGWHLHSLGTPQPCVGFRRARGRAIQRRLFRSGQRGRCYGK